jgi:hypothetical protein
MVKVGIPSIVEALAKWDNLRYIMPTQTDYTVYLIATPLV